MDNIRKESWRSPWEQIEDLKRLAKELYDSGQFDLGISQLEEAISISPYDWKLHFNLGLALDAMERRLEAIDEFLLALELNPGNPSAMVALATDYTRTGQYNAALRLFDETIEANPDFEPAHCCKTVALVEMNEYETATTSFLLAQQIDPECPVCFWNMGNMNFSNSDYPRAVWCWQRTAMLEPTHPGIDKHLALAYAMCGNAKEAEQHYRMDKSCQTDFGLFLLSIGRIDDARHLFANLALYEPGNFMATFFLAEIEMHNGNYEKAMGLYENARACNVKEPGTAFRLAEINMMKGNNERALELLRLELKSYKQPNDRDVLLAMASMAHRIGGERGNDLSAECLLKIIDSDPEDAFALSCMCVVQLSRKNDIDGATLFTRHSIELGCDEPQTLSMLETLRKAKERKWFRPKLEFSFGKPNILWYPATGALIFNKNPGPKDLPPLMVRKQLWETM
jgi:tetratricopeptide (TPR) repeat protein